MAKGWVTDEETGQVLMAEVGLYQVSCDTEGVLLILEGSGMLRLSWEDMKVILDTLRAAGLLGD